VETRALRYFQTVAECGSYSRGAELLRISQPAVSRQIGKLEDELGARLFKRNGHGVSLTGAGQVLLERCQLVLRELEQTKQEIRNGAQGPSGSIALAVPPAAAHFLVPALVQRFGARYPNVFLKLVGGFSSHIHEWLVRGQVDIVTPSAADERGAQLSLKILRPAAQAKRCHERLNTAGVVSDWREPDVLRLTPVPLYNSFGDVFAAVEALAQALCP